MLTDIAFSISIDAVAIYAAIVASIVAVFEGIRLVRELRHKVVIKLSAKNQTLVDEEMRPIGKATNVLEILIVNHSMKDKFLRRPMFEFNKGQRGVFQIIQRELPFPTKQVQFPFLLVPGQEMEFYYLTATVLDESKEQKATKVRSVVTDTVGKTYRSDWLVLANVYP